MTLPNRPVLRAIRHRRDDRDAGRQRRRVEQGGAHLSETRRGCGDTQPVRWRAGMSALRARHDAGGSHEVGRPQGHSNARGMTVGVSAGGLTTLIERAVGADTAAPQFCRLVAASPAYFPEPLAAREACALPILLKPRNQTGDDPAKALPVVLLVDVFGLHGSHHEADDGSNPTEAVPETSRQPHD